MQSRRDRRDYDYTVVQIVHGKDRHTTESGVKKRLKPKPKTESKSWQTRNTARKDKQAAHAAAKAE